MNLKVGFQISDPAVFVPWSMTEPQLEALIPEHALNKVTRGYYTVKCEPLLGLKCHLGFHFRNSSKLVELEFFRTAYPGQKASFDGFQAHFERVFGRPTNKRPGSEGFPDYEWRIPGALISHYIFDRFGPEEHMKITKR